MFWASDAPDYGAFHDGPVPRPPVRDLCERTALFGEEVIKFAKKIHQNPVTIRLISQIVGAGTSVGANYCEADDAVSKRDFKKSIGTCRKESKETKYWLRMVATAEPNLKNEARVLWQEAKELNLIFGSSGGNHEAIPKFRNGYKWKNANETVSDFGIRVSFGFRHSGLRTSFARRDSSFAFHPL